MKNLFTIVFLLLGTLSLSAQVYLTENFENGIPATWVQETNATDGGWKVGTAAALSSQFYAIDNNGTGKMMGNNDDACNCNKISDRIILAPVDLSMASHAILKFNSYFQNLTYTGATETCFVEASTDGTNWTVLQAIPASAGWVNDVLVSLNDYAGNSTVYVSFHYSDGGGWLYGVAVDEISIFSPPARDIRVTRMVSDRFQLAGNMIDIAAEITNLGVDTLKSFDFTWNDGTDFSIQNITGLSIPFGESAIITHPVQYNLADAVTYNISVSGHNPNGDTDQNAGDNSANGVVSGVTYIPGKKMLVEEATGTWCGWCPRGWEWMDYMAENYPDDFVGIAVHNADPMAVTAYDAGLTSFPGFTGFPSVVVDRSILADPSDIFDLFTPSIENIAPVAPSITNAVMTVDDMSITIDGSAEFVTQLSGINYRLNFVLTENAVKGTGTGWNQVNYYSGSGTDPIPNFGINWNTAAATVPGSLLEYNHVGRWLSNGWAGEAGSVPGDVVAGDVITKSYSGAFNSNWNPFNMEAVIMVLDNATGEALNVDASHVEVICPEATTLDASATTTPSPGTDTIGTLTVNMPNPSYGFGGYTYTLNTGESAPVGTAIEGLANGTYTITISDKIGCTVEIEAVVEDAVGVRDIETLTSITLSPNPTSHTSQLSASFSESVDVRVTVVNAIGQIVEKAQFNNTAKLQHDIDVSKLPAGLYLVRMNVNDQVRTQRLVVH